MQGQPPDQPAALARRPSRWKWTARETRMVVYWLVLLGVVAWRFAPRPWREFASALGVVDLPSFVRVANIHNASYLGALLGLIIATIHLRRLGRRASRAAGTAAA